MKLYVWVDPYQVAYGGSIIYAVAETQEEAERLAVNAPVFWFGAYEAGTVNSRVRALGDPDRILDLPCAECYEHKE